MSRRTPSNELLTFKMNGSEEIKKFIKDNTVLHNLPEECIEEIGIYVKTNCKNIGKVKAEIRKKK